MFQQLKSFSVRQSLQQILNLATVLSTAYMIWRSVALYTRCESPIVVVLSGSMEPVFYRGDLLFLDNTTGPIRAGDIPVFKLNDREIPIVHRALTVHDDVETGKQYILTKGDNVLTNRGDDRGIYPAGRLWIGRDEVIGKVRAHVPYLGMLTIIMNDYPQVKFAVLGILGVYVLLTRE